MRHLIWLITFGIVLGLLYLSYSVYIGTNDVIINSTLVAEDIDSNVESSYQRVEYDWNEIKIIVSSDAGFYSDFLSERLAISDQINGFTPEELTEFLQIYFVSTSYFDTEIPMDFPDLIEEFGHGHALPIIAVIAIENLQRPLPALFGHRELVANINDSDKGVFEQLSGRIDSTKEGQLLITVHTDQAVFKRRAIAQGHSFTRAYYDPKKNEIGLYLDMKRFRQVYGFFEQQEGLEHYIIPSFVSYVSTAFNDDSGHEIAHAYQNQSKDLAYNIPVISEGEALVQGFTRRRNGLFYTLLYNPFELWQDEKFNSEVLQRRVEIAYSIGKPMSPFEADRILELRTWSDEQTLIPIYDLLLTDWREFYSGSDEDVRKRYLEAWALLLMAIRDEEVGEHLRHIVQAITLNENLPSDEMDELQREFISFIDDPMELIVSIEQMWVDAERIFPSDPNLAAVIYQWIYLAEQGDFLPLIYLGDALYRDGHYHLALRYYTKAQKIAPERFLPTSRIGDVYFSIQSVEEAKRIYSLALKKNIISSAEQFTANIIRERMKEIENGNASTVTPEPTKVPSISAIPSTTLLPTKTKVSASDSNSTFSPAVIPTSLSSQAETEIDGDWPILEPQGVLVTKWHTIPIIAEAIAGEERDAMYVYTTEVEPSRVQRYYEREMYQLGWSLVAVGTGNEVDYNPLLMFERNSESAIVVLAVDPNNLTYVMLNYQME